MGIAASDYVTDMGPGAGEGGPKSPALRGYQRLSENHVRSIIIEARLFLVQKSDSADWLPSSLNPLTHAVL